MTTPAIRRLLVLLAALAVSVVITPIVALAEAPKPVPARQVDMEVRDIMVAQRTNLEALLNRFDAAPDAGTARSVQLEIRQLFVDTEIRIMRAQIRHLRRLGRETEALELEAEVSVLVDPRARLEQLARPSEPAGQGGER